MGYQEMLVLQGNLRIRVENCLERKRIACFSHWEDVAILQEEVRKKGLINGKCIVILKWFI